MSSFNVGYSFGLNLSELGLNLSSFLRHLIDWICAVPSATMLSFEFPGV